MPKSTKRRRKAGFTTGDVKKEAFRYPGVGITVAAGPTANYSVPVHRSGDTDAFVKSVQNVQKVIPAVMQDQKEKGIKSWIKGDDRPEEVGFFTLQQQQGWDAMEGKGDEGKLYSLIDQNLQKLTTGFDGSNPNEFYQSVTDMLDKTVEDFTKDQPEAYVEGIAQGVLQVRKDTEIAVRAIVTKKLKEVGLERVKSITENQTMLIYTDRSLTKEQQAVKTRTLMTQLQQTGAEGYGLNSNQVNGAMLAVLKPIAIEKSPNMLDVFDTPDATGLKPKNTAGGRGAQEAIYQAQKSAGDRLPFQVYKILKEMPIMQNSDGTPNYFAMTEFIRAEENWEMLGIDTATQAKESMSLLSNSWSQYNSAAGATKLKKTTAGLNEVFKVKHAGDPDKAMKLLLDNPDIDGVIKDRVRNGIMRDIKITDAGAFNQALKDIYIGKIMHESTIQAMYGNTVTVDDGNKLIAYFNMMEAPEMSRLKRTLFSVNDSLTKGGIGLAAHSAVVQNNAKDAYVEINQAYDEAKRAGKPFDWKIPDQIRRSYELSLDDKIKAHVADMNLTKKTVTRTKQMIKSKKFVKVGKGKEQFFASPGITTLRDFATDVAYREEVRYDTDYINEMLARPAVRERLEQKFMIYSEAERVAQAKYKLKMGKLYDANIEELGEAY